MSTDTISPEWVELPFYRMPHILKVEIRAWRPGDGLLCSCGRGTKAVFQCGVPVAVIRYTEDTWRSGPTQRQRVKVACRLHLADRIKQCQADTIYTANVTTETRKRASEAVVAAHYGEFIQALKAEKDKAEQEQLAILPAWLVEQINGAGEDDE